MTTNDLTRLLADGLLKRGSQLAFTDYEVGLLKVARKQPAGIPPLGDAETVFFASQPPRKATPKNTFFLFDVASVAGCDLVELGMSQRGLKFGGININFFRTNESPIPVAFTMLHAVYADRGRDLVDGKTIVVYLARDFLEGNASVKPIVETIRGRPVIYVFYGDFLKFELWLGEKREGLVRTTCELAQPPVRFHLFRSAECEDDTYVLPVAPIESAALSRLLGNVKHLSVASFLANGIRGRDVERFIRWYVFASII